MALVLCVSAFFIAFAAAILYTAGMLTAQSNQRLNQNLTVFVADSFAGETACDTLLQVLDLLFSVGEGLHIHTRAPGWLFSSPAGT